MNDTLEALSRRFTIPGIAQLAAGNGGLPKVVITTSLCTAEIYLHGAQVTSFCPALPQSSGDDEVLFLSAHSRWEEGRAIRGGIPICFPWFRAKADNLKAPSHGFVRTKAWQLDAILHDPQSDLVTVTLSTGHDDATLGWWPYPFRLQHRITAGLSLTIDLITTNIGSAPIRIEEAFHTYFLVGDATRTAIHGLEATEYLDNADANLRKQQKASVTFAVPTDRVYLNTTEAIELVDPARNRRLRTEKQNSLTTVIWNPWREGAAALGDLGDEEWRTMACVEASNILDSSVLVEPGAEHTMSAVLRVLPGTSG